MQSLENIVSYPWIKSKLVEGTVSLTGWYFDFESGVLMGYNPTHFKFEPLVDDDKLSEEPPAPVDQAISTDPHSLLFTHLK